MANESWDACQRVDVATPGSRFAVGSVDGVWSNSPWVSTAMHLPASASVLRSPSKLSPGAIAAIVRRELPGPTDGVPSRKFDSICSTVVGRGPGS